ncbi:MAG: ribosome maturation factor RimP [Clostridia bacterium]|nr:ribosome maturation factor RimP [Clostridia bacterium]
MLASKVEEIVWAIADPIAKDAGVFVYDVEFKKEGPDYYLRVYIDRLEDGIYIDDCEAVSRALSDALDEADPISEGYYLEVSSPGVERQLKRQEDFDRFNGEKISVKLFKAVEGTKQLIGFLKSRNEEKLVIETEDGKQIEIENKNITTVRLSVDF